MESHGVGGCVSKSRGEMGWVVAKERPNYYSTESEVTFSTPTWLKMSLFVFFISNLERDWSAATTREMN